MGADLLIFQSAEDATNAIAQIDSNMGLPNDSGTTWDISEVRQFEDGEFYSIIKPSSEHLEGVAFNREATSQDVIIPQVSNSVEYRQALIEQLISAAAASDISIEFDRYYFNNRLTITQWIIDGGNGLTELATNASEDWWDERATPSSPSPREYAMKLLSVFSYSPSKNG